MVIHRGCQKGLRSFSVAAGRHLWWRSAGPHFGSQTRTSAPHAAPLSQRLGQCPGQCPSSGRRWSLLWTLPHQADKIFPPSGARCALMATSGDSVRARHGARSCVECRHTSRALFASLNMYRARPSTKRSAAHGRRTASGTERRWTNVQHVSAVPPAA